MTSIDVAATYFEVYRLGLYRFRVSSTKKAGIFRHGLAPIAHRANLAVIVIVIVIAIVIFCRVVRCGCGVRTSFEPGVPLQLRADGQW